MAETTWSLNLQDAMNVVQISKEDQDSAFAMISAVLWLGNITFSVIDNENHVSVDDNEGEFVPSFLFIWF